MSAVVYMLSMFIRHIHSMRGVCAMHLMLGFWRDSVSHMFSVRVRCWFGMSVMFHLGMVMMLMLGVRVCHFDLLH